MSDLKNRNGIAMLPIYRHKMYINRAHQILWTIGSSLEGHLGFFLRFNPNEATVIVTACGSFKGNNAKESSYLKKLLLISFGGKLNI